MAHSVQRSSDPGFLLSLNEGREKMSWDGRVEGRGSKEGGVGWEPFFSYNFVLLGVI